MASAGPGRVEVLPRPPRGVQKLGDIQEPEEGASGLTQWRVPWNHSSRMSRNGGVRQAGVGEDPRRDGGA